MEDNATRIRDSLAIFREYMRLERRRSTGLSALEWERWQSLRKRLDGEFGDLNIPDGCSGRRATPRIPTSLVVRFEHLDELGSLLMSNLSRGGVFIPTETPADIGARLVLRIEVSTPRSEIRLEGEVVSRHVGPAFAVGERGMGIRFTNLDAQAQAVVDELYEQQFERHLRSE